MRLRQYLNGDIIGNHVFFDQFAHKVKVRLRGRWKSDFNFLKPHFDQLQEHAGLFFYIHRVDQRLITVTQVNAAPVRRLRDLLVRPLTVSQFDRSERDILIVIKHSDTSLCNEMMSRVIV